ncbi:hypothetical protein BXY85_1629 [Roseivirga pacifica]|uniref:Uncharacterized protein n=1 Tax=Roseivirga pacifica TaxID=1267423 RepID=A0A1I0MRP0_9BACT|nr:hypothetical protein BXY85_1629 [Roseivirga pacifica]SEV90810.1 hypothetical protein SAMN05216290_0613 [Roseivirga pacifica]
MKTDKNKKAQKTQYSSTLVGNIKNKHISVAPMMDWTSSANNLLK